MPGCQAEFFAQKASMMSPAAFAGSKDPAEGACSPGGSPFVASPYFNHKTGGVKTEEGVKTSPTRVPKSEAGSLTPPPHRTFDSYLNQDSNSSSVSSMDTLRGESCSFCE